MNYKTASFLAFTTLVSMSCAVGDKLMDRDFPGGGLLDRQGLSLDDVSSGPQVNYVVAAQLSAENAKSMHSPVLAPLADDAADFLTQNLGVRVRVLEQGDTDWQAQVARTQELSAKQQRQSNADFFRQPGVHGYAVITLIETTDRASRNEYDYGVRARMNLVALVDDPDKGRSAPVLARLNAPHTVCSRRLRNPPKGNQIPDIWSGYVLNNAPQCAKRLAAALQNDLRMLMEKQNVRPASELPRD